MLFAHDTLAGLRCATDLVNTDLAGSDRADTNLAGSDRADTNLADTGRVDQDLLGDVDALASFFDAHGFTGRRRGTAEELDAVRALRPRLRAAWTTPVAGEVAALVNELLAQADARPWLTRHDDWDWHIHATLPDAPLAHRIAAESAMALADLVRLQELDRLRLCEADDCRAVLVDLSRNHSRRYCDTGNCGNRQHVAAYRARRRSGDAGRPGPAS